MKKQSSMSIEERYQDAFDSLSKVHVFSSYDVRNVISLLADLMAERGKLKEKTRYEFSLDEWHIEWPRDDNGRPVIVTRKED